MAGFCRDGHIYKGGQVTKLIMVVKMTYITYVIRKFFVFLAFLDINR